MPTDDRTQQWLLQVKQEERRERERERERERLERHPATTPRTPPRSVASFASSSAPRSSKPPKVSSRKAPSTTSTKPSKAPSNVVKKDERLRGHSVWGGSEYARGDDGEHDDQSRYEDAQPFQSGHRGRDQKSRGQSHRERSPEPSDYSEEYDKRTIRRSEEEGWCGEPTEMSYCSAENDRETVRQSDHGGSTRSYHRNRDDREPREKLPRGDRESAKSNHGGTQGERKSRKQPHREGSYREESPIPSNSGRGDNRGPREKLPRGDRESAKSNYGGTQGERESRKQAYREESPIPSNSGRGDNRRRDREQSHNKDEGRDGKPPSKSGRNSIKPEKPITDGGSDDSRSRREGDRGRDGEKNAYSGADKNQAQPLNDIPESCDDSSGSSYSDDEDRGTRDPKVTTNWQAAGDFIRKSKNFESVRDVPKGKVLASKSGFVRRPKNKKPNVEREEPKRQTQDARLKTARTWGK
ncbi:hypothetical protein BGAL_0025g00190 [Botrytis galanthina]|uniref:Uncharacterized protein n=1 Tax=Botrytis galanthina TaxID=278940 RepID=A0A4S8RII8_9HELO|nr:hypothetical protein BGAL_0025g00190 [Botrytis galanthina]